MAPAAVAAAVDVAAAAAADLASPYSSVAQTSAVVAGADAAVAGVVVAAAANGAWGVQCYRSPRTRINIARSSRSDPPGKVRVKLVIQLFHVEMKVYLLETRLVNAKSQGILFSFQN